MYEEIPTMTTDPTPAVSEDTPDTPDETTEEAPQFTEAQLFAGLLIYTLVGEDEILAAAIAESLALQLGILDDGYRVLGPEQITKATQLQGMKIAHQAAVERRQRHHGRITEKRAAKKVSA
jgi:hypothetical protein